MGSRGRATGGAPGNTQALKSPSVLTLRHLIIFKHMNYVFFNFVTIIALKFGPNYVHFSKFCWALEFRILMFLMIKNA